MRTLVSKGILLFILDVNFMTSQNSRTRMASFWCIVSCLCIQYTASMYVWKTVRLLDDSSKPPDIQALPELAKWMKKPRVTRETKNLLLAMLGSGYDPALTSIEEPYDLNASDMPANTTTQTETEQSRMKSVPDMSNEVRNMKFDIGGKVLDEEASSRFRRWLWNLSKCPVRYKWLDLGENFFPRYIKKGHCSKKKTCSFPEGLKCAEAEHKDVTLLIYVCLPSQNFVEASCKWRTLTLPVLRKCSCSCRT